MASYLITGASRGIGLEFLRNISADPANTVIGVVRDKAGTEKNIAEFGRKNIHIVQADLTDFKSLKKTVDEVSPIVIGALDYIIANAGLISAWSAMDGLNYLGNESPSILEDDLLTVFRTNVIGNIHLINLYLPLILKGNAKKVICLSSGHVDHDVITKYGVEVAGPYTISKAAMKTAMEKFHAELEHQNVLFLSISPGVVDTGNNAYLTERQIEKLPALGAKFSRYAPRWKGPLTAEESVEAMLSVINRASLGKGYGGASVSQFGNQQWL